MLDYTQNLEIIWKTTSPVETTYRTPKFDIVDVIELILLDLCDLIKLE